MNMKKKNKKQEEFIKINKKMIVGIAPLFPIVGVLLAKNNSAFILVIIGAVCGIIIGKNLE